MDKTDNNKKAVIEALGECYGIVTDACKRVGISRSSFYEWMTEDKEFKKAVDEASEQAIDFVEGKLFQKINGITMGKHDSDGELVVYEVPPSDTAIIFYLKTKAKKRGYIERTELTGADGQPVIWNETKTYKPALNGNGTHVEANGSH